MNIRRIHDKLLLKGIDSYSSWLGKADGAFLVCRPYNSISKNAKAYLMPLEDEEGDRFIECISKDLKKGD